MVQLVSPNFDVDGSEYSIVTFGARLFDYKTIVESPLERAGQQARDLCTFLYENVDFAQFGRRDIVVSNIREALKSAIGDSGRAIPPSGDITTMPQIKHHSNLALALHTACKEWALDLEGADAERLDGLPDGEYLLHLASALKGWQAARDKRFSIRDGLLVDASADDKQCPNAIVFCGKENDRLGDNATLVNPVAYDWLLICAIGILRKR